MTFPTDEWKSWAAESEGIKWAIVRLFHKRMIWRAHNESLRSREINDPTAMVHQWIRENYADSITVGIRRILDESSGVLSFCNLLKKLAQRSEVLSFENYYRLWDDFPASLRDWSAREGYSKFSTDGVRISARRINRDREALRRECDEVLAFVNERVAHMARRRADQWDTGDLSLRYSMLDHALQHLSETFNDYYLLLTANQVGDFEPIVAYGYERAFQRMVNSALDAQTTDSADGASRHR